MWKHRVWNLYRGKKEQLVGRCKNYRVAEVEFNRGSLFKYLFSFFQKEGETFEFPDITTEKEKDDESETKRIQEETKQSYKKFAERNKYRLGLPGWFSL